jgi:ornithine cyclodeaminase/alanine dehydrogenase-like protein (mu-crystallin family)
VWVFDISLEASQSFAREMAQRTAATIQVAHNPSEAVANADIICTATNSAHPVFNDRDIRPGTHINAVGVYKPHMQEVPADTVKRARIVVDSRDACMGEAGDLLLPIKQGIITQEHIYAELGEVVAGTKPGRTSEEEITLFKSVGIAVQDAAAASAVLTKAESLNLGSRIELG